MDPDGKDLCDKHGASPRRPCLGQGILLLLLREFTLVPISHLVGLFQLNNKCENSGFKYIFLERRKSTKVDEVKDTEKMSGEEEIRPSCWTVRLVDF